LTLENLQEEVLALFMLNLQDLSLEIFDILFVLEVKAERKGRIDVLLLAGEQVAAKVGGQHLLVE